MRVLVALEARFDRTPDGRTWSDGSLDYGFWQRYLDVFSGVSVAARVRPVAEAPPHARPVDGPGVSVAALPYFVGPWQFLPRRAALRRALRAALRPDQAVILRAPGTIATMLHGLLAARGQPWGVEVVGDPQDVFAPGGVRSVLRPLLRRWYAGNLRRQCAAACAVAYVTAGALQSRYPAAPGVLVTSYSSIELDDDALVAAPPPARPLPGPFRLVLVGSLEQLYKGPDVLIEALGTLVARGLDLHLAIVGDGRHRAELEALVRARGLGQRVRFAGRLPAGAAVRAELDRADLFVLPSRTEGLPKALVEAMARGLPCLGSRVGGIPELLPEEALVEPGDAAGLAARIEALLHDPPRRARLAAQNLSTARDYRVALLRERRRAFYAAVRDAAAAWQQAQPAGGT